MNYPLVCLKSRTFFSFGGYEGVFVLVSQKPSPTTAVSWIGVFFPALRSYYESHHVKVYNSAVFNTVTELYTITNYLEHFYQFPKETPLAISLLCST